MSPTASASSTSSTAGSTWIAAEKASNTPSVRAVSLATLAQVELARGDVDGAIDCAEKAMEVLAAVGGMEEGEGFIRLVHVDADVKAAAPVLRQAAE